MKKITSVEEAERLLLEIKQKIRKNGLLFLRNKEKNCQTLARLGIMAIRVREIIDGLQAKDYYEGPDPDEKYPSKWISIFGVTFQGTELYIKFSVGEDDTPVVCLSFHEAERPMTYQFK
jgi:hypothetical protein